MGLNSIELTEKIRTMLIDLNFSAAARSVKDEDDLFDNGALDSLTLIQFVLALEEEFKIQLVNSDISYDNFRNFNHLVKMLQEVYKV